MGLQEQFDQLDLKNCLLIGVFIAGFYYFFFFNNGEAIKKRIENNNREYSKKEEGLRKIEESRKDQKKYEEENRTIMNYMRIFEHYFSHDMSMNEILSKISGFIEKLELSPNILKPLKGSNEFTDYQEDMVQIQVEGSFHNIMLFISMLTKMERAIDFKKMKLKTVIEGDFPIIRLDTNLVVYKSHVLKGKGSQ